MILRNDMTFPAEEYERRLRELRERMASRRLDAVIISDPENLMYLTDYQTTGYSFFQALVVPLEKEPFMITREMEASNIVARTWVEIMRPYSDIGDAIQMLYASLLEFGLADKSVGYERNSYFLPAYLQDRFRNAFSGTLLDCFGIVEEGRICKSPDEIQVMYRAAAATEAGMEAGYDACEAGASENEIAAAISSAMFRAGGEAPSVMPYVTSGPRTMIGHATWEGRRILPDEHVFLEVGGCYRRYHTAMMRTVICGDCTDSMYRAQERMMHALDQLHAVVRPGITVSDVDNMIRDIINENDVGASLITRSGYSIGIAFPPSWDEGYMISLKSGDTSVLREGMTFHIIPWMWGVDGNKTCGISDTIHVTGDGCRSFFSLDREFLVKPVSKSVRRQFKRKTSTKAPEVPHSTASNPSGIAMPPLAELRATATFADHINSKKAAKKTAQLQKKKAADYAARRKALTAGKVAPLPSASSSPASLTTSTQAHKKRKQTSKEAARKATPVKSTPTAKDAKKAPATTKKKSSKKSAIKTAKKAAKKSDGKTAKKKSGKKKSARK